MTQFILDGQKVTRDDGYSGSVSVDFNLQTVTLQIIAKPVCRPGRPCPHWIRSVLNTQLAITQIDMKSVETITASNASAKGARSAGATLEKLKLVSDPSAGTLQIKYHSENQDPSLKPLVVDDEFSGPALSSH